MLFADCGSSYTKLIGENDESPEIVSTRDFLGRPAQKITAATGHLGKKYTDVFIGELEALALGAREVIEDDDFTVVDVGSRDVKIIGYRDGAVKRLEWNDSCGAATGLTIDLIGRYYEIDFGEIEPAAKPAPVTCGVFGIERIFDSIIEHGDPSTGIASFVGGVAANIFRTAGRPEKLYLSGGLCKNKLFVESIRRQCEPVLLGRALLAIGVRTHFRKKSAHMTKI